MDEHVLAQQELCSKRHYSLHPVRTTGRLRDKRHSINFHPITTAITKGNRTLLTSNSSIITDLHRTSTLPSNVSLNHLSHDSCPFSR
jgi:hypothetical protein